MEDIQNIIIEKINNYNYDKEVEEYSKELEKNLKQGEIIELFPQIDDKFSGNDQEDIAEKVSKQIIRYKIREKALNKLMSKGLIYPVGLREGLFYKRIICKYGPHTIDTPLNFRKSIFSEFIKA